MVEVRDLFFNVPARRRFLRSEATESTHVQRMVERLALSRFDVALRYVNNGREQLRVAPAARCGRRSSERMAQVLGEEFAAGCLLHRCAARHRCACPAGSACRRSRAPSPT